MLNLFLTFLSYIIHNLIQHLETSKDEATCQDVFQAYMMFQRIAQDLGKFSRILSVWQKDHCHGKAWSGCQQGLRRLNYAMHVLDADLWGIIGHLENKEKMVLRCKLRGGPFLAKSDIFDIWIRLIERNAKDSFCGWLSDHTGEQVSRTVYIPNYSLLLPVVQRTSDLSDVTKSQWHQINFESLYIIKKELDQQALEFLPELAPEHPIDTEKYIQLRKPFYTKVITVPKQEQALIEIIDEIQKSIATFCVKVNALRQVLIAQSNGKLEKVLKTL